MKKSLYMLIICLTIVSHSYDTLFCGNKMKTAQSVALLKSRINAQKRTRIMAQMRARFEIPAVHQLQNIDLTTEQQLNQIPQPSTPILDLLQNM